MDINNAGMYMAQRTELYDLENTNSYCEHNKHGPMAKAAVAGMIKVPEGYKPMICGGWLNGYMNKCYFLGENTHTQLMKQNLAFAASAVVGDGTFIWVTGGHNGHSVQKTTEFISGGSTFTPQNMELPIVNHYHGMVAYGTNKVMIIGGHDGHQALSGTLVYDLTDIYNPQLLATVRPELTSTRAAFGCGVMTDIGLNEQVIIVAGGDVQYTRIERWIVGSNENFEASGTLVLPLSHTASVSHASGVYFFGNAMDQMTYADIVQKAACHNGVCSGTMMTRRMQLKRTQSVAMLAPPNLFNCTVADYIK